MVRYLILSFLFLFSFAAVAQKSSVLAYLQGNVFPDSVLQFSMISAQGTTITFGEILEGHKGKKIVIDVWASWCKDCLEGMPALKKLMHKSRKKNVAYVFISLDKEEKKWLTTIDRFELSGSHYWVSEGWKNVFSNYIGLDWIPRYLVIDENGKVQLPKAVLANDKAFEDMVLE